jgi:hypothetical protein
LQPLYDPAALVRQLFSDWQPAATERPVPQKVIA